MRGVVKMGVLRNWDCNIAREIGAGGWQWRRVWIRTEP